MEVTSIDSEFVTIKTDSGGHRKIPIIYLPPTMEEVSAVIACYDSGKACTSDKFNGTVPDYAIGNAKMMAGICK